MFTSMDKTPKLTEISELSLTDGNMVPENMKPNNLLSNSLPNTLSMETKKPLNLKSLTNQPMEKPLFFPSFWPLMDQELKEISSKILMLDLGKPKKISVCLWVWLILIIYHLLELLDFMINLSIITEDLWLSPHVPKESNISF